jgi:hypothetical protein
MKSKVTRSHSNNNEEVLIDTMGKFVLRLPYKDAKDPICDKVKITNGIVTITDKVVNNIFKVNLDISQTLCNTYDCYKFEEEYRSYLFFKGEKEGDIWHPVGFDGDQTSSPSYIKWEDKSTISYNKGNEKWYFKNHNKTSTKFCAIDNLPTWDKNIYDCLKKSDLKISNTITQYATLDDTTIEKINQLDFENNSDFIEAPSVPLMDIGDLHVSEYTVQHI